MRTTATAEMTIEGMGSGLETREIEGNPEHYSTHPAGGRAVDEAASEAGSIGPARAVAPRPELRPVSDEEVRNHLPLVRQVVQRMMPRKPPEVPMEDLISWGTMGLLDAMRKYDADRDASFATYAQYRIRGSILDYLRRCDWLPRSIRQKSHDIEEATLKLERSLGRQPGDEEIAAEMKVSLDEYAQIVGALGSASMIAAGDLGFSRGEEDLTDEFEFSDANEKGPMKAFLQKERVEVVAQAIDGLPEKERLVISLYYYEGLTMRETAEAMSLTEGRISQLHSQALRHLRSGLADVQGELAFDC